MPGARRGEYIVKSDVRTADGREMASKLQYITRTTTPPKVHGA